MDVRVYQFFAHVDGARPRFIGNPEESGYHQAGDGTWRDHRGNTGTLRSEPLDVAKPSDRAVLLAAYSPDERVENVEDFRRWLTSKVGLNHYQVVEVCVETQRARILALCRQAAIATNLLEEIENGCDTRRIGEIIAGQLADCQPGTLVLSDPQAAQEAMELAEDLRCITTVV